MAGGRGGNGPLGGTGGAGGTGYEGDAGTGRGVDGTGADGGGGGGGAGGGTGGSGGSGGGGNGGQNGFVGPTLVDVPHQGGTGGNGGSNGAGGGGGGGAGGYGAVVTGGGSNTNTSAITGGDGGRGGNSQTSGGSGGDGGIGAFFTAQSASLNNSGQITGGNGGLAANIGSNNSSQGLGGAGIVGSGLTINTTGSITGGTGRGGQADAITFTGGTNALNFTSTNGSALSGGIGVSGTLTLGGGSPIANVVHDGPNGAGAVIVNGSTQTLTGANTYSGGTTISGGTLADAPTNAGTSSIGTGAVTFAGSAANPAILALGTNAQPANGGTFANALNNFGANTVDALDLRGLTYTGTATATTVTPMTNNGVTTLSITENGRTETFRLTGTNANSYVVQSDGAGGSIVRAGTVATNPTSPTPAPCYVTGTRIRVLRGRIIRDVPVERLRVDDLVITASGRPRPIRWIGTRRYPGLSAPKADRPVRIRAGALAEGVPACDLLVSPDHCLMVDGLFVAAGHLSNGTSIVRGEAVRDLTYWHVELDSHDLLLAEGSPAESFLAAPGVRAGFDGVGAADDADAAPVPYALRAERGEPALDALRERLILRAGLSVEPMTFGPVQAWLDVCDGTRVAGWACDEAHPDAPVCLDILVDGEVVALALAQDHRADLAAAGLGDGRHGFDITLDAPLARGMAHTVEVRRSADGQLVAAKAVDAAGTWTALLAA